MTYKVEYTAGFRNNEHNHAGYGPTIYVEEIVDFETKKDYFDYVDFFLTYAKKEDTYFKIKLLEERALKEEEELSKKKYMVLRDAMCEWAKKNITHEDHEEAIELTSH